MKLRAGIVVAILISTAVAAPNDVEAAKIRKFAPQTVVIDGERGDWAKAPQLQLKHPDVPDLKQEFAAVAWTETELLVCVAVRDSKLVNANTAKSLKDGDALDFRFCPDAAARATLFELAVAPTSENGQSRLTLSRVNGKSRELVASAAGGTETAGVRWAVKTDAKSWTVEAAIPHTLTGLRPEVGGELPFVMVVWDRDDAAKDEWGTGWKKRMESFSQKKPAEEWPSLVFGDERTEAVRSVKGALKVVRHDPCNLFRPDEEVTLTFATKLPRDARGSLVLSVRDAYGKPWREETRDFVVSDEKFDLPLGKMPRGYWELDLAATVRTVDETAFGGSAKVSFGVMEQPNLSLAEFTGEHRRFGMKWWGGVTDKEETKRLLDALGLNWSRAIFREAREITTNTDLNCIVKVERFPRELYDEAKYGPLAEWEKKFGRGGWTLKTLPKEAEYRAYLREQIAAIPAGRNVFEVWNEPWDKLNPQDFSTLSGWIVEELRQVRPGAVLGPNLKGDMSKYGYDAKVIAAGGMKGMDMVCLHPYSSSENRQWLRDYQRWISEQCGRPIDIYITEYGSHSCPAGPSRRTEREQSAMVIRQSLCLYAEGCKALVPHWIGQSERNPNYHEDWFGYIRKNQQPKPALLALANCARLIDASEYRGDLWFGPGLAAMLFAKDGQTVLALYGRGEAQEFALKLPASKLTLVNTYGTEREVAAAGGEFKVKVGGEPIYLVGLPGDLTGDKALRPDRFPAPAKPPKNVRKVAKMAKRPVFDGKLDDWRGAYQVAIQNEKVNGDDASGIGYLAWDDAYLYVAVAERDNELLNKMPRATLYRQDSLELFVSTEPRDENGGYGPNDRQFIIAPISGEGGPICGFFADRAAGIVEDVPGALHAVGKTATGWTMEVAIPWSFLNGFKPSIGARIAFEPHLNDADSSHERWKLEPLDGNVKPENPTVWSIMEFAE